MNKQRLQSAVQNNILREKLPSLPNFLQKLWVILNTQGFEHVICWDESGESFHIIDSNIFCKEVLPNFFKHNNLNSFVRQLNLYGFRKVASLPSYKNSFAENSDNLHFANQCFVRGQYNQLHNIKRNAVGAKHRSNQSNDGVKNASTPSGKNVTLPEEDLICLLQELKIVRERQSTMKNTITQLTRDNILLWQEMAALRNSYLKQRDNVGKLVQFLMQLGQQHTQKRMPSQQQRFVQLEELDSNGGPVQLNYNTNMSQSNSSNCLALQQNSNKFGTLDCEILDGIQQELSESIAPHDSMSLDVETSLLEGLQLRQRAIEEGGPYLDSGILSAEDQFQAVDRPLSLRNEERMRYYENAGGIQLKRPFQRRVLSPGASPVDFYPKRAFYSGNQNQELVPASSSNRSRIQIHRSLNDQSGRSDMPNTSNIVFNNDSSPEPEEQDMQYYLEDGADGNQLLYDEEFANEENDDEFNDFYPDGELMFNELDEQDEDPNGEMPVKNN